MGCRASQVPSWPSFARDIAAATGAPPPREQRRSGSESSLGRSLAARSETGDQDAPKGPRVYGDCPRHADVCLGGHAAIRRRRQRVLFHPLRVPEADRVLLMANQYPAVEKRWGTSQLDADYDDRLRHVHVFEEQALYNFYGATIEIGGLATRMAGMVATPSLFRLLRVVPAHGRIFSETEGTLGNEARVILTDGLWRELFAADPAAIGRTLRLTGREFTIVGVLPPASRSATPTPASGFLSH